MKRFIMSCLLLLCGTTWAGAEARLEVVTEETLPDGTINVIENPKNVLFARVIVTKRDVIFYNADKSVAKTILLAENENAVVSPAGDVIAITSWRGEGEEIEPVHHRFVTPEGRTLFELEGFAYVIDFSPDGERILMSNEFNGGELFFYTHNGSFLNKQRSSDEEKEWSFSSNGLFVGIVRRSSVSLCNRDGQLLWQKRTYWKGQTFHTMRITNEGNAFVSASTTFGQHAPEAERDKGRLYRFSKEGQELWSVQDAWWVPNGYMILLRDTFLCLDHIGKKVVQRNKENGQLVAEQSYAELITPSASGRIKRFMWRVTAVSSDQKNVALVFDAEGDNMVEILLYDSLSPHLFYGKIHYDCAPRHSKFIDARTLSLTTCAKKYTLELKKGEEK